MTAIDVQAVLRRVDDFVAGWIGRREALLARADFPQDIWRDMADRGLLGLGLPVEDGGLGGDYATMAAAARRMTGRGGVMGMTMTWLGHNMNAWLHLGRHGTAAQRAAWLPRLAAGEGSVSIAISEPGVGGHPKHLKTRARRDGGDFVIDGAKTYLTNGPLAAVFIVLAVTGETEGRKSFSALLVPRDTPGLRLTPGARIDFLHPSPHCGIELDGCRVPAENLLGQPDGGWPDISLPTRAVEDVLSASVLAGALRAQLPLLADGEGDSERLADLGQLLAKADALDLLAGKLAAELDADDSDPQRLNPATAGFRGFVRDLQADIDAFAAAHGVVLSPGAELLRRDLVKTTEIAASVHRVQAAKRARAFIREGKDA